jgi:hypothetical protein
MTALPHRVLTRRALLGAASFAGTAAWAHRASGRQSADPVVEGDCEVEPAVKMLFDWRSGLPVYQSVAESGPQLDWQPFNHPSFLGPFLIPPGWTGSAAWADSFTRDGVPEWRDVPMSLPQLTLSRVTAPDGDASFEYAIGSIQNALITTRQTATIAKQSVLDANPRLRPVCSIDDQGNALAPGWFSADRHRSSLLITFGTALTLPSEILPATVISFNSLFGRRRQMEELMYDVFLRILFQFLGGGSGDPIPTPTPT